MKALMVALMAAALAFPGFALAQPRWDVSMSVYAGKASPADTDIHATGSVPASYDLTANDIKVDSSTTYGLKLDFWRRYVGVGLDVSKFKTVSPEQRVNVVGRVGAVPVNISGTLSKTDLDSTVATVNVMVRTPFGVSTNRPYGSWYPYIGYGIGTDKTKASDASGSDTDTSRASKMFAGVKVFMTEYLALFAEYSVSKADKEFLVDEGERDSLTYKVKATVAGLAYHF